VSTMAHPAKVTEVSVMVSVGGVMVSGESTGSVAGVSPTPLPPPQAVSAAKAIAAILNFRLLRRRSLKEPSFLTSNQNIVGSLPSWAEILRRRSAFYQRAKRAGCAFWSVQVWWALMARAALV
jgi:hypothetical protein